MAYEHRPECPWHGKDDADLKKPADCKCPRRVWRRRA